ncbi:MAG: hypothetical protein QM479_13685 [Pseudomonadota bacterium]
MRKLSKFFNRLFCHDKWVIGVSSMNYSDLIEEGKITTPINWLEAKFGEYIADPFIFKYQQDYYLFYELFSYIAGDAKIAVTKIVKKNQQWQMQTSQIILDEPFHQSYPFVFEFEDKIYCIPEQSEGNCVKLFQATEFPYQWQLKSVLIEGFPIVDPTIFQHHGLWWLLATKANGEQDSHLYAWYADNLEGPWLMHKNNPIKIGFGETRPAGNPFKIDSGFYRPVQGFKQRYGDSLLIYKINELSIESFNETIALDLAPFKEYPYGLHHISINSEVAVFDAKRYANLFEIAIKFIGIIIRKLRKR